MDAPPALENTLPAVLGFELLDVSADLARARVPVEDRIKQPMGLVHGGVYAALSETIVSVATFEAVKDEGKTAVGMSNDTSFMRPVLEGHVNAEARVRHRGRTTWIWEVDMTDDEGRLCALSRVTMAVRPAR